MYICSSVSLDKSQYESVYVAIEGLEPQIVAGLQRI